MSADGYAADAVGWSAGDAIREVGLVGCFQGHARVPLAKIILGCCDEYMSATSI